MLLNLLSQISWQFHIISELKNEKYIPYIIGSNPKNLLTPEKIIDGIHKYLKTNAENIS